MVQPTSGVTDHHWYFYALDKDEEEIVETPKDPESSNSGINEDVLFGDHT